MYFKRHSVIRPLYSIQFLFIYLSNRLLHYCHAFTHQVLPHTSFVYIYLHAEYFLIPDDVVDRRKLWFLYFFKTDSSLRPHLNILIFIASVFSRNDNFWILQCIASPIHSVPRIYVKDDKYVLTFMHIWPLSSIIKPPSESRIVFVASLMWILRPKIQQRQKKERRQGFGKKTSKRLNTADYIYLWRRKVLWPIPFQEKGFTDLDIKPNLTSYLLLIYILFNTQHLDL